MGQDKLGAKLGLTELDMKLGWAELSTNFSRDEMEKF